LFVNGVLGRPAEIFSIVIRLGEEWIGRVYFFTRYQKTRPVTSLLVEATDQVSLLRKDYKNNAQKESKIVLRIFYLSL